MTDPISLSSSDTDSPALFSREDDTTEWLDWEHWQGVEEYQALFDGLGGPPLDDSVEGGEAADETSRRQLRRHLHRRGIELER